MINVDTGEIYTPVRSRVQKFFNKPSLTRQEFKAECDLGLLLKRFSQTPEGRLALQNAQGYAQNAQFYDVSNVPDYRTALDQVNAANAKFMALPAVLRRRFDNDPAVFLDFVTNPANLDECRSLGLAKPKEEAQAQVVSEVPEAK